MNLKKVEAETAHFGQRFRLRSHVHEHSFPLGNLWQESLHAVLGESPGRLSEYVQPEVTRTQFERRFEIGSTSDPTDFYSGLFNHGRLDRACSKRVNALCCERFGGICKADRPGITSKRGYLRRSNAANAPNRHNPKGWGTLALSSVPLEGQGLASRHLQRSLSNLPPAEGVYPFRIGSR